MVLEERRQRVLNLVSEKGFVSLADLATKLDASQATIRRDLDFWHQQGAVKRTHGGAVLLTENQSFPALDERSSDQIDEKRLIARAAAARVQDGDSLLLDGGTTTLEVARLLVGRRLQIVTNSLPIANLFASSRESDLVILGGYVYPHTGVALGPSTIRMLEDIHVHQMILSVGGLTSKGLFNSNLLLVETERRMMQSADEVVVVADHTKIGCQALAFLCSIADVDTLIVDDRMNADQRAMVEQTDARLIVAGEQNNGQAKGFEQ